VEYQPPAPAADAGAAGWIAPRLLDDFGTVCRTIPTGFEAYARVFHPADPGAATPTRWAEVAARTGRSMHAQAQFHRIVAPLPNSGRDDLSLDVQEPMAGDLAPAELRALCAILQAHTPEAMQCWFALWEGWGELTGAVTSVSATTSGTFSPPRPAPGEWQLDLRAARFELPGRAYYLFTGPLRDALRLGNWGSKDWFLSRSPSLFWPADQSWCVASEIDFDSTLIAGTATLVDEIVQSDELEAWPVNPRDSLAFDGDTINKP
jgi:hypothetical protein